MPTQPPTLSPDLINKIVNKLNDDVKKRAITKDPKIPTLSQSIIDKIVKKLNGDRSQVPTTPTLSQEIIDKIVKKLNDDIKKTKPEQRKTAKVKQGQVNHVDDTKRTTEEIEEDKDKDKDEQTLGPETNTREKQKEKELEQIESDARIDGTADVTFRNTSSAIDEKGKMVHGKPRIKSYTLTEKGVLKSSVTE